MLIKKTIRHAMCKLKTTHTLAHTMAGEIHFQMVHFLLRPILIKLVSRLAARTGLITLANGYRLSANGNWVPRVSQAHSQYPLSTLYLASTAVIGNCRLILLWEHTSCGDK